MSGARWTKRAEQAPTRFVGYFPTPQFWAITKLWDDDLVSKYVEILSIKCSRTWMSNKRILTPLPFVDVTALNGNTVVVDYNFIKHGKLDVKRLCQVITDNGAKDMVIESLCVCIPKDSLEDVNSELKQEAEMMNWRTGDKVAAFFRRTKAVTDETLREQVRKATQDWLPLGGKLSTLDLVGLRESHYWYRKGEYGSYEINFMERTVRLVMTALDPEGALARLRVYIRKKGDVWALADDRGIRE